MTLADVDRKLAERYGRTGAAVRRRWWWAVGVIAAVVVGLLAWSTVAGALGSVAADTTGYKVIDERTVTVSLQVSIAPGTDVACAIEAQDAEHGIVGWKVVEYAASDAHTRRFTETVPTVAAATNGLVRSCWIL
ncbi:DUF4307 domain-containing protein [Microbacterium sp. 179-B 1A2 NHS]|uniref:DUF4307 domain-containing protein n=1 Tax=Microbacterium sp. 179-B 1A2 NHS TaxID=3142383 RepID=UPI0039A0CBF9